MSRTKSVEGQNPQREGLDYIAEQLRSLALPIAALTPDAANARKHDEKNIEAIMRSLTRFGQRLPIVVQQQGMIVRAGNGRVEAAKRLGWKHIACVVVDEASVEATSFAIADNRSAELATWDDETLASLLQSLPDDARLDAGFDDNDLKAVLDKMTPPMFSPVGVDEQSRLDQKQPVTCPSCGNEFVP